MGQIDSLYRGRFLEMVKTGRWEYVRRSNARAVICIITLTKENELIFIEQFRPPVDGRVIEMPAGLVGDIAGEEDEDLEKAARRELWEETGYEAERFENLGEYATSAGLCDETVTMFLARDCNQTGAGGGDEGESIQIHTISLNKAASWLEQQQKAGRLIDARVLMGMWLLEKYLPAEE